MAGCLSPRRAKGDIFPCGKCVTCLQRRASGWALRLSKEKGNFTSSLFITLTYNEDSVPVTQDGELTLKRRDVQLFMKRLRKSTQNKLKYYTVGEYGGKTERPHYHMILYGLTGKWKTNVELEDKLKVIWKNGNVRVDPCNDYTIKYVVKYLSKRSGRGATRQREFSLMSKGLGESYLSKALVDYYKKTLLPYLILPGGQKHTIPRYYKEKMYTEEERAEVRAKGLSYIDDVTYNKARVIIEKAKRAAREKRSKI